MCRPKSGNRLRARRSPRACSRGHAWIAPAGRVASPSARRRLRACQAGGRAAPGRSCRLALPRNTLPARRLRRPRGRGFSSGGVWFGCGCRCRSIRREQTRDTFDKPPRGLDRLARGLCRHVRTGAGEIIGNGFELVSAGKERPQAASTRGSSFTSRENSLWTPECLLNTRPVVSKMNACASWSPAR
jgi:hypothetical protein